MTTLAPGKADREWPPRVWVHMDSLKNPKATYFVAKNEKFDGTEYLSTAEHQAILAQAVAAARKEAMKEAIQYVRWKMEAKGQYIHPAAKSAFEESILTIQTCDMLRSGVQATAERGSAPKGGV